MKAKRMICIVISLIIMLSLSACKQDEIKETTPTVGKRADFEVDAYLLEEWKITNQESGVSTYYKTILVYTDGYYSEINESDIKYQSAAEQHDFNSAVTDANIEIINVNSSTKTGTCAYVYISTTQLIDTRKIYILVEGPTEYDSEVVTKEDYQQKHGNLDGWNAIVTTITGKTPPMQDIELMCNSDNKGLIRLYDVGRNQYWYEVMPEVVTNDTSIMIGLQVTPLKNTTKEDFLREFLNGCYPANLVDDIYKKDYSMDTNLKVDGYIDGDIVYIGISTVDGSNISEYTGKLPSAIVYNNNYLIHVFNLITN